MEWLMRCDVAAPALIELKSKALWNHYCQRQPWKWSDWPTRIAVRGAHRCLVTCARLKLLGGRGKVLPPRTWVSHFFFVSAPTVFPCHLATAKTSLSSCQLLHCWRQPLGFLLLFHFFIQLLFQPAGMSPAISRLTAYNPVIVRALALFLRRSGGSVYAEMTEQNWREDYYYYCRTMSFERRGRRGSMPLDLLSPLQWRERKKKKKTQHIPSIKSWFYRGWIIPILTSGSCASIRHQGDELALLRDFFCHANWPPFSNPYHFIFMLLLGKYAKIYILIFNSLPIILRDIQYITIENNIFFFVLQTWIFCHCHLWNHEQEKRRKPFFFSWMVLVPAASLHNGADLRLVKWPNNVHNGRLWSWICFIVASRGS